MEISKIQLDNYKKEYEEIKKELPIVTKRKQDARAEGDLSENAEYDIARTEHEQLTQRLNQLENIIANAVVVDSDKGSRIGLGSYVKVKCLTSSVFDEMILRLDESGDPVSDPKNRVLDVSSALGKKIFNGVSGIYKVQTPSGEVTFSVTKVKSDAAKAHETM